MRKRIRGLICALLAIQATGLFAAPDCALKGQFDVAQISRLRDATAEQLNTAGVPMMVKQTGGGTTPVILVNSGSYKKLAELFQNSLGVWVQLQPDYRNDHGMLRVADKVIDVDSPGARGYGELHETGLSWKSVQPYMARQRDGAAVKIEVNYVLTKPEMAVAEFYQRIRRSAIFRVPFTFWGGRVDLTKPNSLQRGGEHCFVFCRGGSLSEQVSAIGTEIQKLNVPNVETYMGQERVKSFLNIVRQRVNDWPVGFDEGDVRGGAFENNALSKMRGEARPILEEFADIFPAGLPEGKKLEFANWVVSHDAATEYQTLLRNLRVGGGMGFEGMGTPRATFVLIYDFAPGAEQAFRSGTYTTRGIFSSWTADGQMTFQAAARPN